MVHNEIAYHAYGRTFRFFRLVPQALSRGSIIERVASPQKHRGRQRPQLEMGSVKMHKKFVLCFG